MNLFTIVQTIGLGILWAIKSSSVALVFPLFVVGMVPLRLSLAYFYTSEELEAVTIKFCYIGFLINLPFLLVFRLMAKVLEKLPEKSIT